MAYTVQQAADFALQWCRQHQGWMRVCDLPEDVDADDFYTKWEDVPATQREWWLQEYGRQAAKKMWEELGVKTCKIPYGFVSGKGEFFEEITQVPLNHNSMMVFKFDEWIRNKALQATSTRS